MKTRLKELRLAKGLKQEEVAKILGIGRTAYGAYEIGDNAPPLNKVIILSKLYNVSIDYIMKQPRQKPTRSSNYTKGSLTKSKSKSKILFVF